MLAGQAVKGLPTSARPAGKTTVAFPARPPIRCFKQLIKSQNSSKVHRATCRPTKVASAAADRSLMASKGPVRKPRRTAVTKAASAVQASYASSDSSKSSLTPVLFAVAIASLGALLFGLHVAVVNGLQDAVSKELGFYANTGLRGAVSSHMQSLASVTCTRTVCNNLHLILLLRYNPSLQHLSSDTPQTIHCTVHHCGN